MGGSFVVKCEFGLVFGFVDFWCIDICNLDIFFCNLDCIVIDDVGCFVFEIVFVKLRNFVGGCVGWGCF